MEAVSILGVIIVIDIKFLVKTFAAKIISNEERIKVVKNFIVKFSK